MAGTHNRRLLRSVGTDALTAHSEAFEALHELRRSVCESRVSEAGRSDKANAILEAVGSRPESRRAALLDELCRRYGYCNELRAEALAGARSTEEVVQAVLTAEGLDPAMCERKTRALLAAVVDDWLFDQHGRGARSKLPR